MRCGNKGMPAKFCAIISSHNNDVEVEQQLLSITSCSTGNHIKDIAIIILLGNYMFLCHRWYIDNTKTERMYA